MGIYLGDFEKNRQKAIDSLEMMGMASPAEDSDDRPDVPEEKNPENSIEPSPKEVHGKGRHRVEDLRTRFFTINLSQDIYDRLLLIGLREGKSGSRLLRDILLSNIANDSIPIHEKIVRNREAGIRQKVYLNQSEYDRVVDVALKKHCRLVPFQRSIILGYFRTREFKRRFEKLEA